MTPQPFYYPRNEQLVFIEGRIKWLGLLTFTGVPANVADSSCTKYSVSHTCNNFELLRAILFVHKLLLKRLLAVYESLGLLCSSRITPVVVLIFSLLKNLSIPFSRLLISNCGARTNRYFFALKVLVFELYI